MTQLPIGGGQNQTTDPVSDLSLVEIDEQPNTNIQQLHVAQKLGLDGSREFFHSFDFYERGAALYQNIESQGLFSGETFVFNRNELLADALQNAQT